MADQNYSKLFPDNIYGYIRVSPMALTIIDTEEFQRLRYIKQLGLCHYVYGSATHTRFSHSIGVYHLASKMVDRIRNLYPNNKYYISSYGEEVILDDILAECIKIGALCHDIGHGPFSHAFDHVISDDIDHPNKDHEYRSCLIIENLCKKKLSNILTDKHIDFIKSIINPNEGDIGAIYQIVSNYLNDIDVDKFDYLARDSKNLGLSVTFDPFRLINEFIIDDNGNIAYPKHCRTDIYEMFHSRYIMFKKVYRHKTKDVIELMMIDILKCLDDIMGLTSSIYDMDIFCKLTDESIINQMILMCNPPPSVIINLSSEKMAKLNKAHELFQRIKSRDLYQLIYNDTIVGLNTDNLSIDRIIDFICEHNTNIDRDDIIIMKSVSGYVSERKMNPFDKIYFYDKIETRESFTIDKSHFSGMLTENIQEVNWLLIIKKHINIDVLRHYKYF